jgi:hypothetical protein
MFLSGSIAAFARIPIVLGNAGDVQLQLAAAVNTAEQLGRQQGINGKSSDATSRGSSGSSGGSANCRRGDLYQAARRSHCGAGGEG